MAVMSNDDDAVPPVSREVVLDVRLPAVKPAARVEIRRIHLEPGVAPGFHVHNGPVFGSVVSGSVVYQIDGEAETVLRPGDVFYEPEGVPIARFDATDEGVTFLGYFLLEDGQDAEITMGRG